MRRYRLTLVFVLAALGLSLFHRSFSGAGHSTHLQEATPLMDVGFLITAYKEPIGQIQQKLRLLRHSYPEAPVVIRSDGGSDYTAVCKQYSCRSFIGRRLAHPHRSWYTDNDFGFDCLDLLRAWDEAVSWMNTSWFVVLEPDTMLTRAMSLPPPGLKVTALANSMNTYSSEFLSWIESHDGRKVTSTWGNPGGLIEVAAWKAALHGLAGREEALKVHDVCHKCLAGDECVARLFALDGQDLTHWVDFFEVGMKFPARGVAAWDSMAEFKVWPHGTDVSQCLDCLRRCSLLCPPGLNETMSSSDSDKAIDCIVSSKCGLACPALLHRINSGGICGLTLASTASMYRKNGNWKGELLLCLTTGFCRPDAKVYVRHLWVLTWLLLACVPAMAPWCVRLPQAHRVDDAEVANQDQFEAHRLDDAEVTNQELERVEALRQRRGAHGLDAVVEAAAAGGEAPDL